MPVDEPADEAPSDDAETEEAAPAETNEAAPAAPAATSEVAPGETLFQTAEAGSFGHDEAPLWRNWTDASGKHQTRAVLVNHDRLEGTVSLRKENGKRIRVPFDRLSEADQDFVRTLAPAVASAAR